MHGHNRSFKGQSRASANPLNFLNQTPFKVDRRMHGTPMQYLPAPVAPFVYEFDIDANGGNTPGVFLQPFTAHAPSTRHMCGLVGGFQSRISAYWLEYQPQLIYSIPLGTAANYVFTPMLDGCYVGIGGGSIVHVAGDVQGPRDTASMRAHALNRLGALTIGFDSNLADANLMTLVGVRTMAGWRFYVQGHDYFHGAFGALQPIYDVGNALAGAAGLVGQNVITLNGMALG